MIRLLVLTLLILLVVAPGAWAQSCAGAGVHTLADGNPTTLQNCLNSINADGTTALLPPGTFTWTAGINYTANFNNTVIQGAGAISATTGGSSTTGTDQTTIIDNFAHGPATFQLAAAPGKSLRITGFCIRQNASSSVTNNGVITLGGTSTSLRIDHMHFFTNSGNTMLGLFGAVQGVADHDFWESPAGSLNFGLVIDNGELWNGDTVGFGDKSWTDSEHWGSSQFFFIEDSRFVNGDINDSHDGSRYVFRHNTVTGPDAEQHFWHGETPGNSRASKEAEIYLNSYTNTANNGNSTFSLNSGTALYWGNVVSGGYRGAVRVNYDFRTTAGGGGTYFYGDSWHFCGVPAGGPTNWDRNLDSTGYACIDQPGRAAGDLLTGSFTAGGGGKVNSATGTISWPHQALSPIYIWNNTYTPQFFTDPSLFPMVSDGCNGVCAPNREYYFQFGTYNNPGTFNGTIGVGQGLLAARPATCTAGSDPAAGGASAPGVAYWATDVGANGTLYVCNPTNVWTVYYTPFTYPHPLTGGVTPPIPPNPPSGLSGTVAGSTVNLSWTASTGTPVPTGYSLYRGTAHNGPYTLVKTAITSTSTSDTPPNGTWFYTTTAFVGGLVSTISGNGSTATVTCMTACSSFPTGTSFTIAGNSTSAFNGTFTSTGQPTSATFTFTSVTNSVGSGGAAWPTSAESAKSNEVSAVVPAAATVTLTPASLTFASRTVGTTSPSQAATLTNTSGAGTNVVITSITASGDFAQTNTCPGTLPSSNNCVINVTFTPTAPGARSGTLTIVDNAAGSPHTVALSGTGVAQTPIITLTPASHDFGSQLLSTTSTAFPFTLTNSGSGTATITSITPSGDFAVFSTTCGGTLAAGQQCFINVNFTPTATGGRTGSLSVVDSAAGSPHVATLSGTGITSKCQASGGVTISGQAVLCGP